MQSIGNYLRKYVSVIHLYLKYIHIFKFNVYNNNANDNQLCRKVEIYNFIYTPIK